MTNTNHNETTFGQFVGYFVTLGSETRFVIPAILEEVAAEMIRFAQDQDPQDEFTISIKWGNASRRPDYAVHPDRKGEGSQAEFDRYIAGDR